MQTEGTISPQTELSPRNSEPRSNCRSRNSGFTSVSRTSGALTETIKRIKEEKREAKKQISLEGKLKPGSDATSKKNNYYATAASYSTLP